MDLLGAILRLVHILAAIAWVGGAFFVLAVLDPLMGRLSAAEGNRFMRHIQLRTKLAAYFPVAAVLSVVAGFLLFLHLGEARPRMDTPSGQVFHLGVAAGILGLVWGGAMEGRLNGRIGKLARRIEAGPADPALETQMTAMSARLRSASRVSGALLLVAAFGMATFRYF